MLFEILSYLLTEPIEIILGIIFSIVWSIKGVAVDLILFSFISNILFLFLFYEAKNVQHKECDLQKRNGKDYKMYRIMIQLVPTILLLLYFLTSFRFFSELNILSGNSFGPISNLGVADHLISGDNFSISFLPFVFLLVGIGTIFLRRKNPILVLIQDTACVWVIFIFLFFSSSAFNLFWISFSILCFLLTLVLFLRDYSGKKTETQNAMKEKKNEKKGFFEFHPVIEKNHKWIFFAGIVYMILLTGLYIPANIIKESPAEFVDILDPHNPMRYLLYSFVIAVGFFGIWANVFYLLAGEKIQYILERVIVILCMVGSVNYIASGTVWGQMTPLLAYPDCVEYDGKRIIISVLLSVLIAVAVPFIMKKWNIVIKLLLLAEAVILILSISTNVLKINRAYKELTYLQNEGTDENIITLSKNGKNVVYLIMDRALGEEVPFLFQEKPELYNTFSGFTYYQNTVSFGGYTNAGMPAVYGGYEYTPERMNERADESVAEKHDEALKVLPVLFDENDYNVTVCDPVYAGYKWIPDLSIYDDYPDIKAYNTIGKFNKYVPSDAINSEELLKRNFFFHSIMKIAPLSWHIVLLDEGNYCNPLYLHYWGDSYYRNCGYDYTFMEPYMVLDHLIDITTINEEEEDNFLLFYNSTPHMACLLQEPDYVPKKTVDNTEYHKDDDGVYRLEDGRTLNMNTYSRVAHYHINMATLLEIGKWLDYLKENDCYDNTRVIIVSDHGRNIGQINLILDTAVNAEYFLPLFMVKDFGETEFKTDETFMTNADAVYMATKDVIENPENPFTGKSLKSSEEDKKDIKIYLSHACNPEDNPGNVFVPGEWFTVHDNPYEVDNWECLGNW